MEATIVYRVIYYVWFWICVVLSKNVEFLHVSTHGRAVFGEPLLVETSWIPKANALTRVISQSIFSGSGLRVFTV